MVRGRRLVKVINAPWVHLALARRADNLIGKHWLPQTFTSFLFTQIRRALSFVYGVGGKTRTKSS